MTRTTLEEERRIDRNEPDYEAECAGFNCITRIHDPDKEFCGSCRGDSQKAPALERRSFPSEFTQAIINAIVSIDSDSGEIIPGPRTIPNITYSINSQPGWNVSESRVKNTLCNLSRYGVFSFVEAPGVGMVSWTFTGDEEHVTYGDGQ